MKEKIQKKEESKMRKTILMVGILVLASGLLYAGQTDTVDLTVTCRNLSVAITESTIGFGVVNAGSTGNISASSATVTNDGNWNLDYELECTNSAPTGWTPTGAAAPTTNAEFRLLGLFNGPTTPVSGDFTEANDYLNTSARKSDATTVFVGTQDGDTVAQSDELGLWFRFDAPTGTPAVAAQTITMTITAQPAD